MKRFTYAITTSLALFALPAISQERSFLCKFTTGPRAGQIQDYTGHPAGPLPVGTPCNDGISSAGVIISPTRKGDTISPGIRESNSDAGTCRKPISEDDCEKCKSDKGYDRCMDKLDKTSE